MYEERGDFRTLVDERSNATVLDAEPSEEALVQAIEDGGPRKVEVEPGNDIAVNVITNEQRPFTALHLVNYSYAPETDTIETKSDIAVSINGLDFDVEEAVWYSPDTKRRLDFDVQEGTISATVPELNEWGFVVFAPSAGALEPAVEKATAENQLSGAQEAVATAEEEGRTHRLERAKINQQRTEIAAQNNAHQQVVSAAETAADQAEAAYQPPVIGLDQAHNNSEDHAWSYYRDCHRSKRSLAAAYLSSLKAESRRT